MPTGNMTGEGYPNTNARINQTFDQIGLFFREKGLPTYLDNETMGDKSNPRGPDYGVFKFNDLFSNALLEKNIESLSKTAKDKFVKRFEHKISDHMPIWLRIPLPDK